MADSGSDMKSMKQCADTGQTLSDSSDEKEVSSVSSENLNGSTVSPKANPFQVLKPAMFLPSGTNPFATTFKADSGLTSNASHTFSPAKFVLRPSALSSQTHNDKTEVSAVNANTVTSLLKPAKLPDPTKQSSKDQEGTEKENTEISSSVLPAVVTDSVPKSKDFTDKQEETKEAKEQTISQGTLQQHEKKLPDSSCSPSKCNSSVAADKDKIFGENLADKVTGVKTSPKAHVSSSGFVFGENLAERVQFQAGDKETEFVDSGAASPDSTYSFEQTSAADGGKTLEESAREYQATHGRKTELQEVEVVTGEENESNVIQANGKLFVFDGDTQNWVERGRGLLRLNDMTCESSSTFQSRLLMRTQGSLRLILNTKIWSGMIVERASHKSVRITGTDGGCVKVFLIMMNPKDTENLLRALDWRVQQLRVQEDITKDTAIKSTEKRKAESHSPDDEEFVAKILKKAEDECQASYNKQEESDSSIIDPETEVSSESQASSFTPRTDSD